MSDVDRELIRKEAADAVTSRWNSGPTYPARLAQPIVVGLDGAEPSRVALEWALKEAQLHRLPVHLLTARMLSPREPVMRVHDGLHDAESNRILETAVARLRAVAPTVSFSTQASRGVAAALLVEASRRASLVVVGARGRGALKSAFLGSTSLDVAANAACPVAVVQHRAGGPSSRHGVVVAVDDSDVSRDAVALAFLEAAQRHLPLTVVHAWLVVDQGFGIIPMAPETIRGLVAHEEQDVVAEAVRGWAEKYPEVTVRRRVVRAHPVEALIDFSRDAELVVVGSRGRGGFGGLLLGSVSQGVLHHAHCPVVVVRPQLVCALTPGW